MTTAEIPKDVRQMFKKDSRIVEVRCYDNGWVPNAYRWPAPGEGRRYTKHEDGTICETRMPYDRKRSLGIGPYMTAFSARSGLLASC